MTHHQLLGLFSNRLHIFTRSRHRATYSSILRASPHAGRSTVLYQVTFNSVIGLFRISGTKRSTMNNKHYVRTLSQKRHQLKLIAVVICPCINFRVPSCVFFALTSVFLCERKTLDQLLFALCDHRQGSFSPQLRLVA